ncbi:hypothetical protein [Neobacillus sp. YIM B06451]|uniref:hypothetical protein n=1 Tax=Neobacillus sp. YIM B06451 TaxID=3070994 RepID=UPI00293151CD|nr:hypothetical protein [Neobacillus sp. YIM B06451]
MKISQSLSKIKKILLLVGSLVLLMILGACNEENSKPPEFKKQYYEGKSDNWYVKMESEADSERTYTISYIGEENKPLNFKFEIYESSFNTESGDGELKNQEEFEINKKCSGACDALPESLPIEIQWGGKKEKVVIRNRE